MRSSITDILFKAANTYNYKNMSKTSCNIAESVFFYFIYEYIPIIFSTYNVVKKIQAKSYIC